MLLLESFHLAPSMQIKITAKKFVSSLKSTRLAMDGLQQSTQDKADREGQYQVPLLPWSWKQSQHLQALHMNWYNFLLLSVWVQPWPRCFLFCWQFVKCWPGLTLLSSPWGCTSPPQRILEAPGEGMLWSTQEQYSLEQQQSGTLWSVMGQNSRRQNPTTPTQGKGQVGWQNCWQENIYWVALQR